MKRLLFGVLALLPLCAQAIVCNDPRVVMSQTGGSEIDLRTANSSGTFAATGNKDAIVQWVDQRSTGTGVIDPFLRVQAGGNVPCEAGFNTDGAAGQTFDDIAGLHTHALATSSLTTTNIGGTNYVQFLLDINQTGDSPLLSLEALRIFSFGAPDLDRSAGLDTLLAGGLGVQSIFNMDDGENRRVLLNYNLNTGSGSGDMFLFVNADLFAGAGDWIYFFSRFGAEGSLFANNDGFEEWALVQNDCPLAGCTSVPEPGSLALLGVGLVGIATVRRRRLLDA